jgi:hypothetical protein
MACDGTSLAPRIDLAAAQSRWEASGVVSYDFDLRVSCFCGPTAVGPVTISIRDGQFTGAVSIDSGAAVDSLYFQGFLTIDRVFATLHRVLDAGPAAFTASYDADLGFPAHVSWDSDFQIADDELALQVLAVRPVGAPIR